MASLPQWALNRPWCRGWGHRLGACRARMMDNFTLSFSIFLFSVHPLLGLVLQHKAYTTHGLSACTSKASYIFKAGRAVVIIYSTLLRATALARAGFLWSHRAQCCRQRSWGVPRHTSGFGLAAGWGFLCSTSMSATSTLLCHTPCSFFQGSPCSGNALGAHQ